MVICCHLKQRRLMTLIEVMIVVAILGLVGGVAALNINRAIVDQRLQSEVSMVVNQLRLAQNLMLMLDQDVIVKFTSETGGREIRYGIKMQCPLQKGWQKELNRPPPPLRTIRVVDLPDSDSPAGSLEIKFMSKGVVMTKGILRLSTAEHPNQQGAYEQFIALPGFPSPIVAETETQANDRLDREDSINMTDKLTQFIKHEIASKQALKSSTTHPQGDEAAPTDPKKLTQPPAAAPQPAPLRRE